MLAGLQGSGKTTTAGKLARWFKQQGRNPMLVGADLQRPAAVEQLRILAGQVGVPMYSEATDPVTVAKVGLEEAQRRGRDVLIVDTAGRLHVDEDLMDEVAPDLGGREPRLHVPRRRCHDRPGRRERGRVVPSGPRHRRRHPHQARRRRPGRRRPVGEGGHRASPSRSRRWARSWPTSSPSTPTGWPSRILGMGDMLTLIEKAEQAFEKDQAQEAAEKLTTGTFTLEDFLEQMQQIKKMGPLQNLVGMLPGVPKELKKAEIDEREIARLEAIIRSMTPEERRDPAIMNGSRRLRIAQGSGNTTADVNQLLKQFKEMQKMMKMLGGRGRKGKGGPPQLAGLN